MSIPSLIEKPVRVQRSRQRKLESPNGLPVVCVDRSTCWGNPFRVGAEYSKGDGGFIITPEYAVALFLEAIKENDPLLKFRRADLWKLRGKNLACWCSLSEPHCHAMVLLELANGSGNE